MEKETKEWRATLGLRIAFYRKKKGWSQLMLAERAGVSAKYISSLESPLQKQMPSFKTFCAIAYALGVSPHQLLER